MRAGVSIPSVVGGHHILHLLSLLKKGALEKENLPLSVQYPADVIIIISLLLFMTGGRRDSARVQGHAHAVPSLMNAKGSSLHGLLDEGFNSLRRDFSLKKPGYEQL